MAGHINPVGKMTNIERRRYIFANLFFIVVLFPYVSPFKTPFDTQPWALLAALALALIYFEIPRPLAPLFFVAAYAALVLAVGLIRKTSVPVDGLRSLACYLAVCFIALAAYKLHAYVDIRLFLAGVAVWLAVGVLQLVVDEHFLLVLLPRATIFGNRGVLGLAPEPAYYARVLVAFFILNEIFRKEKRYSSGLYLAVAAALAFQIVITFSVIGLVYLLVGAAAKGISLIWENSRKERWIAAVVALILLAGFAAFFLVPDLKSSRGGAYLQRASGTLWRRNTPPTTSGQQGSPRRKVPGTLWDQSTSTKIGNLVWGFYGGLVETRGLGFGLGSKTRGEVPPWLSRLSGVKRSWGGRIGGGLVQGVYELGVIGLIFFFVPLWIIAWSAWKSRPLRSALWLTLILICPAAMFSESPAFPLFGYLLGVHTFYLQKAREAQKSPKRALADSPGRGPAKKVLVLNQYFPPDIASTGQYAADICRAFRRAGWHVHVVAGQPSYQASAADAPAYEEMDGLAVYRLPLPGSRGREKMAVRVIGYATFLLRARRKARRLAKDIGFEAVVTFHNPPFLGLIGAGLVPGKIPRFIFVSYDLHPDALLAAGWKLPRPVVALWNLINKRIYGRAEHIVVLVEGAKEILHQDRGVPLQKIRIIPLWGKPELEPRPPDLRIREELGLPQNALLLLYAGNMGIMHPLEGIIEAALDLKEEPVYFVFLGEGLKRRRLMARVEEHQLGKVLFLPYQPEERFIRILSAADACFVSFGPGMERITIPSRTYTFLSAGKPLISIMSPKAEVARLVAANACGWNVSSGEELAGLLRRLLGRSEELAQAARNARAVYVRDHRRDVIVQKYVELLGEKES